MFEHLGVGTPDNRRDQMHVQDVQACSSALNLVVGSGMKDFLDSRHSGTLSEAVSGCFEAEGQHSKGLTCFGTTRGESSTHSDPEKLDVASCRGHVKFTLQSDMDRRPHRGRTIQTSQFRDRT